jgi:hypothetical protein
MSHATKGGTAVPSYMLWLSAFAILAAAADVLNRRIYKLTSYKRLAVAPPAPDDMQ